MLKMDDSNRKWIEKARKDYMAKTEKRKNQEN